LPGLGGGGGGHGGLHPAPAVGPKIRPEAPRPPDPIGSLNDKAGLCKPVSPASPPCPESAGPVSAGLRQHRRTIHRPPWREPAYSTRAPDDPAPAPSKIVCPSMTAPPHVQLPRKISSPPRPRFRERSEASPRGGCIASVLGPPGTLRPALKKRIHTAHPSNTERVLPDSPQHHKTLNHPRPPRKRPGPSPKYCARN